MEDINPTLVNVFIMLIYLITLFVFSEIKSKVREEIVPTFTYLSIAVSLLILIRIIDLSMVYNIFYVPYLQEIAVLLLSVFIFLASVNFLRFIRSEINEKEGDEKKEDKKEKSSKKKGKKTRVNSYYRKVKGKKKRTKVEGYERKKSKSSKNKE